eukprot:1257686-Pyramimonas_sp.AAC.1
MIFGESFEEAATKVAEPGAPQHSQQNTDGDFVVKPGYLANGMDIRSDVTNVSVAEAWCKATPSCCGFTFKGKATIVSIRGVLNRPNRSSSHDNTHFRVRSANLVFVAGSESPTEDVKIYFKLVCQYYEAEGWYTYTKPAPLPPAQQGYIGCAGRTKDTTLLSKVFPLNPPLASRHCPIRLGNIFCVFKLSPICVGFNING